MKPGVVKKKWRQIKTYDENFILIKPKVDASDKQIFMANNCRTNADFLFEYLQNQGTS